MTDPRDGAPAAVVVRGRVRGGSGVARGLASADDLATWIATVWDDHRRDLFGFASALARDPDVADDLVAEAFLRLIREARADRMPDDPRAWLYRVVANLSLSRGRRLQTAQRFVRHLVDRRVNEPADARCSPSSPMPGSRSSWPPAGARAATSPSPSAAPTRAPARCSTAHASTCAPA